MINLNVANDLHIFPLSEEERIICEATGLACNEIKTWIENVTNKYFLYPNDFRKSLADGVLLCNLLNSLKSGSIKRINKISTTIAGYDNLEKFLRCCHDDFGLSSIILFKVSDLEDLTEKPPNNQFDSEKRLERVVLCLYHLAKSVENQCTTAVIDSKPFNVLMKSQDIREIKRMKSNSSTYESVFESPVPEKIQKQVPNYLANKAHETLQQTKKNQEIFKKSVESDDWQESLENWKERRRQALSLSAVENISLDMEDGNSANLIKLKENARKMKQLRDQIKDQHIQPSNDQLTTQTTVVIPDIDDETKAMIERVKQRKLAEEQKRQFSISSPTMTSFASDSELSTSTAFEKPEEDSLNISEKNKNDPISPLKTNPTNKAVPMNRVFSSNEPSSPKNSLQVKTKMRIISVKLNPKSKQESEQLWGMDLISKSGAIVVSKVKIGSSSDVCDIRKGDEIISINSRDVTNQSISYVKSIFNKCTSDIFSSEDVRLCLKRHVNDKFADEDESISENVSTHVEHKLLPVDFKSENKYLSENYLKTTMVINTEPIDIGKPEICDSRKSKLSFEQSINDFDKNLKKITTLKSCEKIANNKESSSLHGINIAANNPDISKVPENDINLKHDRSRLSVQDKIAKFESQKVLTPSILNSSLNVFKNIAVDFSGSSVKCPYQTNNGRAPSNDNVLRPVNSNTDSSISKHPFNIEILEPMPSSHENLLIKNPPLVRTPVNSSIQLEEKDTKLEVAEQQFDVSKINVAHSWKTIPSSGNSSTSDDVSALNESTVMSQSMNPPLKIQEDLESIKETSRCAISIAKSITSITAGSYPMSNSLKNSVSQNDQLNNFKNNPLSSNISTGIQTDLLPNRHITNYTSITTAFENRYKPSCSISNSKQPNNDICTISSSKFLQERHNEKEGISPIIDYKQQLTQPCQSFKNGNMKDLNSINPETDEKENHKKLESSISLSTEPGSHEKSVEIDVSITPKLFPMRNKTLFTRTSDEKLLNSKINDSMATQRSLDEDENTLLSDCIKVTNLDDIISPIKEKSKSLNLLDVDISPTKEEIRLSETLKFGEFSKPAFNNVHTKEHQEQPHYDDILEFNMDTEPWVSTVAAPTLCKNEPKSDNTLSIDISYSKSEKVTSAQNDSPKKSKKSSSKINDFLHSKRSTSTKELRNFEDKARKEMSKSNTIYVENPTRSSSTSRKSPNTQVSFSNVTQDLSKMKSQTKSYSIEKSIKTPLNSSSIGKKKEKSKHKKSTSAELSTKCNKCSQAAGSEDLMVIEELNLHFHLRCFVCTECKVQLGDGKCDTDVRIRQSKLHCPACYNKKSSKSKHRNPFANRQSPSILNNIQHKGGHGDGRQKSIEPVNRNSSCAFSTSVASTSSPSSSFVTNVKPLSLKSSIQ